MSKLTWPKSWLSKKIRVAVIGAGGNGSEVMDGLLKFHNALLCLGHEDGIHVTLVDDDLISSHNIIRQRFFPYEVGQPKAETLIHKANCMFGTDWRAIDDRFPVCKSGLDFTPDLLISCVDNIKARREISLTYKDIKCESLWLDMGNGKSNGQIIIGHLGIPSGDRIDNVIDMYPEILTTEDKPNRDSCSSLEAITKQDLMINVKIANAALNLLWQLLRQRELSFHGIVVDLVELDETPIVIRGLSH